MMSYLSYLLKLQEAICQPNPQFYPDQQQRADLYVSNCERLKGIANFLVFYAVLTLCFDLRGEHHIVWLGINGPSYLAFLLFCRTRIRIFHWTYTLLVTFGQMVFIQIDRNCFIHALITSFLSPLYVMEVSKDLVQAVLSFVSQMIFLHFQYKPLLPEILQEMSHDAFAAKLINAATLMLISSILIYSVQFKDLRDTHKNLQISKQEAQNAYTKLQLFLQTFSHELRNPLNSLLGNLQLLLQENLSPSALEMTESAKVCSDLLLQLINNILDSGKAQVGKLDVSPAMNRLGDFVGGMWRISRHLIKKKRLNGFLQLDRKLPSVLYVDFYRLNQILLNLVSNAVKFTDKGRIWIRFSWLSNESLSEKCFEPQPYSDSDDEGVHEKNENLKLTAIGESDGHNLLYLDSMLDELRTLSEAKLPRNRRKGVLKITIEDTGAGMSKESLDKLFTKFSQVSDDPTKRKVGAGLGLYITKEICELMKGEIRAYSKVGTGSTFIVCIPTYCPGQIE